MQVFKTFMKVMKKRLHISMIYIIIFIVIGIVMTASSSDKSGFSDTKLSVSITDLDDTDASHALADYIGHNNEIVKVRNNTDSIMDAVFYRRADIILTVNKGYSEKIANGETTGLFSDYRVPGSYSAELFDSQINRYVKMITACTAGGMEINEAAAKTAELAEKEIKVEKLNFSENSNVEFGDNIRFYYQYLAYILLAIMISGLCPVLLVITRKDIRNRTSCSCLSEVSRMAQIVLGTVIFAVGLYLLLTVVALFLYRSQMLNSKGLFAMLNGFVYLIFTTMLAILISVISPGGKVIDMIANVVSLGMSFLCGVFVPQSVLSETVLDIGKFLPAYWYIKANNMIAGIGGEIFGMRKYMICIGIELAFSVVLFCITLLIARTKKSSRSI